MENLSVIAGRFFFFCILLYRRRNRIFRKGDRPFMRNTQDRLLAMHTRAEEIRRQREKIGMRVMGAISGALMVCLVVVMHQVTDVHQTLITGQGEGTSLLSESAGGYILIAVIAFFLGAMITALAIRYRKLDGRDQGGDKPE